MPHQCVRCNAFYADDAREIINGCSSCTGKLFFYVKQSKVKEAKETVEQLTEEQKMELEERVSDVLGHDIDEDTPVVLDLESIRVTKAGTYELDLVQLFSADKPIIYKMGEGKYVVDLDATFLKLHKK
jgi:uncharacterized protein